MPANGCEVTVASDANNCGAGGNVCPLNDVCKGGGCTCPMCNIPNASANCVNNMCVFAKCNPGFYDCTMNLGDGCEVNANADPQNCGMCRNASPLNPPRFANPHRLAARHAVCGP